MTMRRCDRAAVAAILALSACVPHYQAATLSTMGPNTRVTLMDSCRVAIKQPEVRGDSLYSATRAAIRLDSVSRVEAERGLSQNEVMGAIAGATIGVILAWQLGAFEPTN